MEDDRSSDRSEEELRRIIREETKSSFRSVYRGFQTPGGPGSNNSTSKAIRL